MIEFVNVCKKFGRIMALNEVSLDIGRGITAIIGPNGAGKTTLIRLILGLLKPTSGELSVMGVNPATERDRLIGSIAYVPEKTAVYEKMTAHEYLSFFAALKGLDVDVEGILARYGLIERADDSISTFSKGMKRRLELARVLMSEPEILVLDEPFSGIDPESRIEIRKIIQTSRSKIVVMCSHDLHEVEQIADTVVVLRNGNVVLHDNIERLLTRIDNIKLTIRGVFDDETGRILGKFGAEIIELRKDRVTLIVNDRTLMPALIRELSSNYELFEIASDTNLEKIFIDMIKLDC
ncbi:ABC transporter ATP-binding protein [Archaeoglobus veneficus]|uniref:Sulfate-transporting ATPase n=1 Tax=Archaeoglobus veneficus (strain DSM 11195 / SNP6) TaxID=693661 RepID=F2KNY6_ARCVS|nr:ABC transporter ATP-binding protein [Archaeoglobus veneficus]AEA46294.1 Sulfate-transporting ATPase [Archaeoglobus veneficus SNP6]